MRSLPNRLVLRVWGILLLACCLSAGIFLSASQSVIGLGFPLDDAWIHQTYARNLGALGQWSFTPGVPSAGSTSPLWTALLSFSYLVKAPDPRPWTYFLGVSSLVCLAFIGQKLFDCYREPAPMDRASSWLPWAGLFLAFDYHLVWASVSGMETNWMGLLVLFALWRIAGQDPHWLLVGALIGLACWVRPDGITLLGPTALVLVMRLGSWRKIWPAVLRLGAGFLVFFLPYLAFNYLLQGAIWPNTFYAKQAEYAVLQERPLLLRVADELSLPLIGAGLLLLPGFVAAGWRAVRSRRWEMIGAGIWFLGYASIYAWRLPVTYQYGRYLMPAMPVYFVLGLSGTDWIWGQMRSRWTRLAGFGWKVALGLTLVGFLFLGMSRYAQDVAIIETEMVSSARWLAVHTAPDDLIAVHDIGVVGYFSNRRIVDLAGLVTPEVIPILRDETRLAAFLDQRGVRWLVTFPGWYQQLAQGKEVVFNSQGRFSPANGGENMQIYRWK